jgi:fructosamine-3-kinase
MTPELRAALEPVTGEIDSVRPVGGGSISASFSLLTRGGERYFLKTQAAELADLFDAEADGLAALSDCGCISVPRPLASGVVAAQSYLLLQYLDFAGDRDAAAAELGRRLAEQHGRPMTEFGWPRDNFIGSTPQPNGTTGDWIGFLRDKRLGFQFELAARNGFAGELQRLGRKLLARLPEFFDEIPRASLLHGDLWGGNWGALAGGRPVIFDPAVYIGDREADLAMTRLFGGFPDSFYSAYSQVSPPAPGFEARIDLYNLYHLLNHLNLFGQGYLGQVEQTLRRLLADQ